MKKIILSIITLAAMFCACTKEEIDEPIYKIDPVISQSPLVFTASMEGIPDSRVTLDEKVPSWEIDDQVNINNYYYIAKTAGTRTTFVETDIIRPTYVSSTNTQSLYNSNPASNLVDEAGTSTRWCASTDYKVDGAWNIVVSAGRDTRLKSILLWNAESGHGSYVNRLWKEIKVFGSASSTSGWEEIGSFDNLDLKANNYGFAGEIVIDATNFYTFYRIDILDNTGDTWMQMSDMKFKVEMAEWVRPAFVSSTDTGQYGNNYAANLVDDAGTSTRWCASTGHKVDGAWNIVVSTERDTQLKSILLWNAENGSTYSNRIWKKIKVYGSEYSDRNWEEIQSFDNLDLAANNYGLAGKIAIDAVKKYTFYRIDVLENKGDEYMQMSDMKFEISPESNSYNAFYPSGLYNGATASLPANYTEIWMDGRFNMPMYAQSSTTALNFKNLCGVLKIKVTSDQIASVKSIKISSINKATSGEFTVSSDFSAQLKNPETIANTVTVTYTNAVPTTEEGTTFYVAIPAQTYQNLKIKISSAENIIRTMTTKDGANIQVERNKIYPISFLSANDDTIGSAYAKGLNYYVEWVQLWKDGPKFAVFNLGAANKQASDFGDYVGFRKIKDGEHNWGDAWRVPIGSELEGLNKYCNSTWTSLSGVPGRLYTGRGAYAGNSIFFPAAGREALLTGLIEQNQIGHYWSSTTEQHTGDVYELYFTSSREDFTTDSMNFINRYPVRLVCIENNL